MAYRLTVCHVTAMNRHHQKNDRLSQLEQEVTKLTSTLAETMAAVAVKDSLLIRSETARTLAENEASRLHARVRNDESLN